MLALRSFAPDSALEGDGFEPPVPRQIGEVEKVERDNGTGCGVGRNRGD